MRTCDAQRLQAMGVRVLEAAGVPSEDANLVMAELIEASLMGLDSHGLVRLAQYIGQIRTGSIRPGHSPRIVKEHATTLIVDGGMNFGMVTARYMTDQVARKAADHALAAAASRHTHHVGRLGSYVQRLAEAELIGLAFANASRQGHYVTPFGGTRGRLGTNPLAYACPTGAEPIVLDISTSMIAEGGVRVAGQRGQALPPDCILDPEGQPTTNPDDFYRDQWGAILPFGGRQGYKGFGLALLVELLGATLAGAPLPAEDEPAPYVNGFFILAIDPDAFCGRATFRHLADELADYIRSSPPMSDSDQILMPGEREWQVRRHRLEHGVPIPDRTWQQLVEAAATVDCDISALV